MSQARRIRDLIDHEPGLFLSDIAERLDADPASVGRDLYFMALTGKVRREKDDVPEGKLGPKQAYRYFRVVNEKETC